MGISGLAQGMHRCWSLPILLAMIRPMDILVGPESSVYLKESTMIEFPGMTKPLMTTTMVGLLAMTGCGLLDDDEPHVPNQEEPNNQEDPSNHEQTNNQSEEEYPEMAYRMRPDRSFVTASHVAWMEVDGAAEYHLVVEALEGDERTELHRQTTTEHHAQIPADYRQQKDARVFVEAVDEGGQRVAVGDDIEVIEKAQETEFQPFCREYCSAPQYAYSLRVWGNVANGNDAQIQIDSGLGYEVYTYQQFLDLPGYPHFDGRDHFCEDLGSEVAGEIIYNGQCSAATGHSCFIEKDAGPWQSQVTEGLITAANGWNANDICGVGINDLIGPFNSHFSAQNPDKLPSELTCAGNCYGSGGGGGGEPGGGATGDWPWNTVDDMFLGRPIDWGVEPATGGGGVHGGPNSGPGIYDDVPLGEFLEHLADALADGMEEALEDEVGDDRYRHRSIAVSAFDDPENTIHLNLDHLREYGAGALPEVMSQLEEGQLYRLHRLFGEGEVYGKAMVHR